MQQAAAGSSGRQWAAAEQLHIANVANSPTRYGVDLHCFQAAKCKQHSMQGSGARILCAKQRALVQCAVQQSQHHHVHCSGSNPAIILPTPADTRSQMLSMMQLLHTLANAKWHRGHVGVQK